MVAPITGPFVKTEAVAGGSQVVDYNRRSTSYRQRRPYDLRLPYELRVEQLLYRSHANRGSVTEAYFGLSGASLVNKVHNQAYARFVNKLGNTAELGAGLAEARSSIAMMANRFKQLADFTRALKRGDWVAATQILAAYGKPPKGWGRMPPPKRIASGWLELWFGWVPLVGDIGNAIRVLESPIKSTRIRAQASGSISWGSYPVGTNMRRYSVAETYYEQLLADVYVSNPNLRLASQMGFINPASVAWELVPFSFVVDWFVNVGDVISSMSDFAGLTLVNPATTQKTDRTMNTWWTGDPYKMGAFSTYIKRTQGISGPTLALSTSRFGIWQASYSIALLTQLFPLKGRS